MKKTNKKFTSILIATLLSPILITSCNFNNCKFNQEVNSIQANSAKPIVELEPRLFYSNNEKFNYPKFPKVIIDSNKKDNRITQAPKFEEIYTTKFPSAQPIDSTVTYMSNGWPTISSCSKMTYLQLFLNEDVASYFDPSGNPATDLFNLESLYSFTVQTPNWDLSSRYDQTKKKQLNFYLNDQYADDTIKCLNNPIFYQSTTTDSNESVYSQVKSINFSNNNLWCLPNFDLIDLPYDEVLKIDSSDQTTYKELYFSPSVSSLSHTVSIDVKSESKTIKFVNANRLETLNIKSNHITALPMVHVTNSDATIKKYDLTGAISTSIEIDDNYIGVDPTWQILDHPLHIVSFDVAYEKTTVFKLSKKKTDTSELLFQTSCLMTNESYAVNYLLAYCEKNKVNVESLTKKQLEDTILLYIDNNYLASDYIYSGSWFNEMAIKQIQYGKYMYAYFNTNTSKGLVNISIRIIASQSASYNDDKSDFNVTVNNDDFHQFVFLSYRYLNGSNVTLNVAIIVSLCLLAVIGWFIFYYTWFKKYRIEKRKSKDMENINNTK